MIWRAEVHDVAAAEAVLRAAFTPFIAVIGQKPAPMRADLAAAQAAGQLWVAGAGEGTGAGLGTGAAVTALMVCFAQGEELELDILAVAPEAQGQGLGAALEGHAEALARASGLRAVTLYTNAAMTGAQRLYDRLGFQLVERRQQDGFDRLFYRKAITGGASLASPASS
ncbi:MAG: GNAT family N-acetyltransferase [Gemmobacter sp.]|uniref:GNAT family N-acetyltransferase n=1 Tax=Gemmobacter sp. TaxID=1898957 RepID=UPI001A52A235|nr:GNAT family N-acetyltransferase [Gemmobacter sp.]MBL8560735.1 GNAT family N-acetyltransferase [Gemmobacter sp.]